MYRGPIVPRIGGQDFRSMASDFAGKAIGARSAMRPGSRREEHAPGKTMGGAIGAAAGMGLAGYAVKGAATGGWWGAAAGLAAYMLS